MQKRGLILLSVATLVLAGSIFGIAFANRNSVSDDSCSEKGKAYAVRIENDQMSPSKISAELCDTLTITNKDDKTRKIGFGAHDQHVAYDGVSEKIISKDESFTITLNKTGTYHFHDHFQEEIEAEFTVTNTSLQKN